LYVSTSIKIYTISRNQTITYDDGNCIKQGNPDGTTTLFLGGGAYEVHIDGQTTTVTKYYAIAGQRVMRDSSGLHYLLTDHLGSVVAILDSSGDLESDERYLPFGGLRDTTGISQTDFSFTGQRNLSSVGLMDYNARWYLASVGRFISADTLVSDPGNPQSMNRYTYVLGNPIGYSDPSGHRVCDGPGLECEGHPLLGCIDGLCPDLSMNEQCLPDPAPIVYRPEYRSTGPGEGIYIYPKLHISEQGTEFIYEFEGFSERRYEDIPGEGDCSIGPGIFLDYGVCDNEGPDAYWKDRTLSFSQAREWYDEIMRGLEKSLLASLEIELTQNQFDALLSLQYNIGLDRVNHPPASWGALSAE
jgi:RHS repeat-associated protein